MQIFPEAFIILVPLVYFVVIVYVLTLVSRLVKAVERIANKLDSPSQ